MSPLCTKHKPVSRHRFNGKRGRISASSTNRVIMNGYFYKKIVALNRQKPCQWVAWFLPISHPNKLKLRICLSVNGSQIATSNFANHLQLFVTSVIKCAGATKPLSFDTSVRNSDNQNPEKVRGLWSLFEKMGQTPVIRMSAAVSLAACHGTFSWFCARFVVV